jgi:DNA-binding GntR family transcriptional regulator
MSVTRSRFVVSLGQKAYEAISSAILAGELAPGDPLDRKAFADRLQISLAPVHTAVSQLEADGLLVTLPRRGTHVRGYRAEDVRGHEVVRLALETAAARLYAGSPVASRCPELISLSKQIHDGRLTRMERSRADIAFHLALVETAGVAMLTEHFKRVMNLGLFLAACGVLPMGMGQGDDHTQLLDDLSHATPDEAEARIRTHVMLKGTLHPP